MGYDEKEELEQTSEFLLRIREAGNTDDLLYVPKRWSSTSFSQPVPPPRKPPTARGRAAVPVMVVDDDRQETILGLLDEPEHVEPDIAPAMVPAYAGYGPWEWFGQVEEKFEEEIRAFYDHLSEPEPDLPIFNTMVLPLTQPRVRGRSARMAAVETPAIRELVSV